ncbi:MAG: peptidoglycan DD-metalloendopeptidase family protein [Gammaproteobacteria bacterium]|nr:peptidoglycan DD-metalloendopeptidase family protein [Gammaproteobacteria bacterium]
MDFSGNHRGAVFLSPRLKPVGLLVVALLLTACGGGSRLDPNLQLAESRNWIRVVRPGDTLFSIAWMNELDYHDIARWNHIKSPYLIRPGQVLRLYSTPGSAPRTVPPVARSSPAPNQRSPARPKPPPPLPAHPVAGWIWPVQGALLRSFSVGRGNKGIDLGGRVGQPVRAAAGGRVVYRGSGLSGYGALIILKHNPTYLSAYAHNATLLVQEGQSVRKGQVIATMGRSDGRPLLHFEIRRFGTAVDPLKYLPPRG